jgi:release factor glutamine methyltransferase
MENIFVSVKMILDEFRQKLVENYRQEEIMQFVYILFEEWKGWSKAEVLLERQKLLKKDEVQRFREAIGELQKNKPIQYIIGVSYFLGTKIKVREGVLIPRPETEELVSLILSDYQHRQYENLSLLDIGAGSGCISVAIKKKVPCFDISTIDISIVALNIAKENALLNQCKIQFTVGDILDRQQWRDFPGYTIIVSNPPYVTESESTVMHSNVLDYEPHEALFVTDDDPLKFYKAIAEFTVLHLLRPGSLYLEINERFGKQIRELLLSKGFDKAEVLKDIHGKDRFIRAEAKTLILDTSYWNVEH